MKSSGQLRYSDNYKINVEVDPEIARLYRWFVPKSVGLNQTRFAPHITVVRNEHLACLERWGLYEGEKIHFEYSPEIGCGEVYWWLRTWSPRLIEIRRGLGLPNSSQWSRPPGDEECFHITIGNLKG